MLPEHALNLCDKERSVPSHYGGAFAYVSRQKKPYTDNFDGGQHT